MGKCSVLGCLETKTYGHHVTYRPQFVVKLCDSHHREITVCNINESEKVGGKLPNSLRWTVYQKWLHGERKPIMTARAKTWMATWDLSQKTSVVKRKRHKKGELEKWLQTCVPVSGTRNWVTDSQGWKWELRGRALTLFRKMSRL